MKSLSLLTFSLLALASCGGARSAAPRSDAPSPPAVHAPAPAAPAFTGTWLGTLHGDLRLRFHLDLAKTPSGCSLDSLDQRAFGIPCGNLVASATSLSLDVPAVHGRLTGTVSVDGNSVNATWSQGAMSLPLVLTRQAAAYDLPKALLDPALPPLDVDELQAVLDADLAATLTRGELAPTTEGGVTIGVVSHGARKVLSYGKAKPDSVFEIGSVTKTFTGLILAQMVEQKKARLDEPVRVLLPAGTVAAPASGAEITLLDLSAQRSGLPRMPDNFESADPKNPYADYDAKALYAFMAIHGVALPPKPEFGYSNLGVGLLGQALANRAHTTYEALLRTEVTGPLGMRETAIALTPALRARLVQGHDSDHEPVQPWDLAALAGAGAIRSTADDMLTYLEAQLHPEKLPSTVRATVEGRTLAAAIAASHVPQGGIHKGMHIALNWFRVDATGSFWHNGATGGYSAFALFNQEKDVAVIVLSNTSPGEAAFTDDLGRHVAARLTGVPAVSLDPAPR